MAFGASEAARWQAYQTRARMGAHLWFQIITTVILGWVALTMYVVWRQTDALPAAGSPVFLVLGFLRNHHRDAVA